MKKKTNKHKNHKNNLKINNSKMTYHKHHQSAVEIVSIILKMVTLIIGRFNRIKLNGVEKLVLILKINKLKKYKSCMLNVNKNCKKMFFGMDIRLFLLDK